MKPDNPCRNHPDLEGLSTCHFCRENFCSQCVMEGPVYYYCRKKECLKAFQKEKREAQGKKRDKNPLQKLVTLQSFRNTLEAQLARTKLEANGIEAYLADENMVSLNPGYDIAFGGIRLQVSRSQAERASKILSEAVRLPKAAMGKMIPHGKGSARTEVKSEWYLRLIGMIFLLTFAFFSSITTALHLLFQSDSIPILANPHSLGYILREIILVFLLWIVLISQGRDFRDISLKFEQMDLGRSFLLIAAIAATQWILHHGMKTVFPWMVFRHFDVSELKQTPLFLSALFVLWNPVFEELLVRAYLMTEINFFTKNPGLAVLGSTCFQTSYHLYQGTAHAFVIFFIFLIFSIYYQRTKRIIPVIAAHVYLDISALIANLQG